MKDKSVDGRLRGRAKRLLPVSHSKRDEAKDIYASPPVDVEIGLSEKGQIRSAESDQSDQEDFNESAHYIETLEANRQVAHEPGQLPPGTTHQVETDEKGQKRLKRKRYSAL